MRNKESGTALNWNYVVISVVVLAIVTLLLIYVPNIREVDRSVLSYVQSVLAPFPYYIAKFVSDFGYAHKLLWPQIAAGSVLVSHRHYLKAFLLIFFTQATFAVAGVMKTAICRQRPCGLAYPGYSFPSDHASVTVCFYGILIYLVLHYVRNDFWRIFLTTLFGIWIFLVAISRMWLNVHFPIDVIGGVFLGVLMLNLFIIFSRFFSR